MPYCTALYFKLMKIEIKFLVSIKWGECDRQVHLKIRYIIVSSNPSNTRVDLQKGKRFKHWGKLFYWVDNKAVKWLMKAYITGIVMSQFTSLNFLKC